MLTRMLIYSFRRIISPRYWVTKGRTIDRGEGSAMLHVSRAQSISRLVNSYRNMTISALLLLGKTLTFAVMLFNVRV
jgi:hypothetical protein